MPRVMTDAETMAVRIGEALNDDVEAWETEPSANNAVAYLFFTLEGTGHEVRITILPKRPPVVYEPEPDE